LRQGHGIDLVETDTGVIAVALKVDDIPAPEGYYDAVAGLESEALKQQLQDITSRGHTPMGYAATRDVLAQIHEDPANTNNVITVYARKSVPKKDEDDWNREHVLPQSYGAKGGDYARSDLHNLFPSIIEINDLRGNLPFDESDDSSRIPRGAKLCSYDNDSWEPPDEVKGDLARAVFYMDVRYDGSDSPEDVSVAEEAAPEDGRFAKLSTLLQWHTQDPVSEEERKRNNQVFSVQGNRNPFIDQPGFVESIYSNKSSSTKLSGTFHAKLTKEKEVITFKGNGMLSSSSGDSSTVMTNTSFDNRWKGIDIPPA
jgi:endonuclease I